jgi:hypothetical protein
VFPNGFLPWNYARNLYSSRVLLLWVLSRVVRSVQVLAEMLARGMVGHPNQPSALLIAPTTSLVATVAMQEDAPLRLQRNQSGGLGGPDSRPPSSRISNGSKIHVVHGIYDNAFCPNQNRWNGISGVELHIVHDNHVITRSASLRLLVHILQLILPGNSRSCSGDES